MPEQFTLSAEEWKDAIRMGGKNAWLNNDHPLEQPIPYDRYTFTTVEAAYKFAKFRQFPAKNGELLVACIDGRHTAHEIRDTEYRLRTVLKVTECWEETRFGVMLLLNREKYLRNPDLAEKLRATHPQPIVEVSRALDASGNPWADRYWGVYVGPDGDLAHAEGCNAMGRIAMQIREELRALICTAPT